jgi:hypothetical protein
MREGVVEAVARIAEPLEELLAGTNHVVSVYVTGVAELGGGSTDPAAPADRIYAAAGLPMRVGTPKRLGRPWRRRLHDLVAARVPTTASWSAREPAVPELSVEQVGQVAALTDDIADVLEAGLGPIRAAYELSPHGDSYAVGPTEDMCCAYDILWDDLLLVAATRAAVLHIGLSD